MKIIGLKSFNILLLLLCIPILTWPAIDNGYPLLYPDSGAYIYSGFQGFVPVDRPIAYGLFVRHISMLYSLWLVIIAQAIITIFLIQQTLKLFKLEVKAYKIFICCILISFTTTSGYYIGQIMPDIFTAYMLWTLAIILLSKEKKKSEKIILYILLIFSSISHFSNLMILQILIFSIIILGLIKKDFEQIKKVILIPFIAFICIFALNYSFEKTFFISKGSNVFFTAKINETGYLQPFLNDNCENNKYVLCNFSSSLPTGLENFLWGEKSIIDKIAKQKNITYDNAWISLNSEFGKMNKDFLTDKKYFYLYAKQWLANSYRQLYHYDANEIPSILISTSIYGLLKWHYLNDVPAFINSKQSKSDMNFSTINNIQNFIVFISMIYLIFYIIYCTVKKNYSQLFYFSLIIIGGYIINACVCEFFSTLSDRFSGRIIWIFPLIIIIQIIGYSKKLISRNLH